MEDLRTLPACEGDKSTEVERVIALVMKAIEGDIRRVAESVVLKRDDELLGPGEFELREKVLGMACHILEATVNDRKKRGTKVAVSSAPAVAKAHDSWGGGHEPS